MYLSKAALQGLEAVVTRTAESFSLSDVVEWLKLLNASHLYDLTEKQTALCRVSCRPSSVERVYHQWEKQPTGLEGDPSINWCVIIHSLSSHTGVLDCVRYTVARIESTGNI